jgi:predicted metal-dependent peptidase
MEKVDKAKALLVLDHPFFGATVSKRPIKYSDDTPTASMSATGEITLNPAFVEPLSLKQTMFLLAHECMHYMLSHSLRCGERDGSAWNIAADKVINDTLIDARVGEFIDGGITENGAREQAAEDIYDANDAGKDVGGTGSDIGRPTDGDGKPLDDATIERLKVEATIETLQAAKIAKQMGKLPASLERLVEQLVNVSTPWYDILEKYMQGKIKDDISWNRPNRRFIHDGMYLPSADNVPRTGEVVVAIDTSASIGQDELNEFAGHINRIMESCVPEKLIVIYCDASVQHVDEFAPDQFPVQLTLHGGGGTSFVPVFDYIKDNGLTPEVLIYLTDGYGDQEQVESPITDVVWLTTGYEKFPFGDVIKYEKAA